MEAYGLKECSRAHGSSRERRWWCTGSVEREIDGIRIVPWESFLSRLRAGEIIA